VHEFPVAPVGNKTGPTHLLEVLRRIGNREPSAICQHLNRALALGKLLQQFEAMSMTKRFGDSCELGKQHQFGTTC
jgi:hypothetical protein